MSASQCVATASRPLLPQETSGSASILCEPLGERNRAASWSARVASATETSCGRCRKTCAANCSRFSPAASATTENRAGRDSTTLRHCRPIEPVEPRIAIFLIFLTLLFHSEMGWRQVQRRGLGQQCLETISMTKPDLPLPKTCFDAHPARIDPDRRSEEHTSELQSRLHLVCRLLLEKKKQPSQAST